MTKEKLRIEWLDAVKGFAILLVMLGHSGISKQNTEVYAWIYSFHMPLFFIASGIVFSKGEKGFIVFIKKKVRTLLVPSIVFQVIQIAFQILYSRFLGGESINVGEKIIGIFIQYRGTAFEGGLWFLPCLFLMEICAYAILSIKNCKIRCASVMLLTVLAGIYQTVIRQPQIWYVDIVYSNFVFFYAGYELKKVLVSRKPRWILIVSLFVIHLISRVWNYQISGHSCDLYWNQYGNQFLFYIAGFSGSLFIIMMFSKLDVRIGSLRFLGANSLIFYVLHQNIVMPVANFLLKYFMDASSQNQVYAMVYCCLKTTITILLVVPCVLILNRFFPCLIGKKRKIRE